MADAVLASGHSRQTITALIVLPPVFVQYHPPGLVLSMPASQPPPAPLIKAE